MPAPRFVVTLVCLAGLTVALQSFLVFPLTLVFVVRMVTLGGGLVVLVAGFAGWGLFLSRCLGLRGSFESAFGLGLMLVAFAVGALSRLWLPGATVVGLLAALGLVGLWLGRQHGSAWLARAQSLELSFPAALPAAVAGVFCLPPLLLALAPPIALDSLVYHLAVPRQFGLEGHAFEMPWYVHSELSRLAEVVFGLTLSLEPGGNLAQLCSWAVMLLTLRVLARVGRRMFGGASGWFSALLLISLPALNVVAGWAWSDWFVLFFLALALEAHQRLCEQREWRQHLALGLFVGAAVAAKYTALPLLALVVLPVLDGARWRSVGAGLAAALLPGLPWTVHNLVVHRNPLFPLLTAAASQLGQYRGEADLLERISGYFGRPDLLDESLGLVLFPAVVLLLLLRSAPWNRHRTLWLQAALFLVAGLLFHPTVRSFAPLLLILCLLAGSALDRVAGAGRTPAGATTRNRWRIAIGFGLLLNLVEIGWIVERYAPISSALGFESYQAYLSSGQDYYQSFLAIESNTTSTEGVMLVGESRIFHLRRPVVAASYLDPHPIRRFRQGDCEGGRDDDCVYRRLRSAGITTVLVNTARYRGVRDAKAPERGTEELMFFAAVEDHRAFERLLDEHGVQVHERGAVVVYRLVDDAPESRGQPDG